MKIEGGTHFLVLRRDYTSPNNYKVDAYKRFDEVISNWKSGDRVSPILSIDKAPLPTFSATSRVWLHFIGPLPPAKLNCLGHTYLSFGLFNIVIFSEDEPTRKSVQDFLSQQNTNWEEWELFGNQIVNTKHNNINNSAKDIIPPTVLTPFRLKYQELNGSVFEYRALIASIVGRTILFVPSATEDLVRFDKIFREILLNETFSNDSTSKNSLLTIANAVLSRYSTQLFSGTSPIVETESHIFSHSLLGVGTAALSLQRLRNFISVIFAQADIPGKLLQLKQLDTSKTPLYTVELNDPFWSQDFLNLTAETTNGEAGSQDTTENQKNNTFPPLTCFSGRDGFRTTKISLSAPTAVITGCNTTSWTLLTLTHEVSHIIVEGVLSILLPKPEDKKELLETAKLLADYKANSKNLFDSLREMLCYTFWTIATDGKTDKISASHLGGIIHNTINEVNETLTHIFDFLYFYRKDQNHYIRSIWSSWGVIPNIRHRISEYIIRSLCALHANNIRREHGFDITIDQLIDCLKKTLEVLPKTPYVEDALAEIATNRAKYRQALVNRHLLVRFVHSFLYSPAIESRITREPNVIGGNRGGYIIKVMEFSDNMVQNPLRFIEEFARDIDPDNQRSLWMLQQLAFGEEL